jgi:hypothetical protein
MADDLERDWMPEAKVAAQAPPEPIPDAADLPTDVPDGTAGPEEDA